MTKKYALSRFAVQNIASTPQTKTQEEDEEKRGYVSPYADDIAALTAQIARDNQTGFAYQPETDSAYIAMRNAYREEAQRAGKDTLGNYAAITGGIPSTAAVSAAAQSENDVMGDFAQQIPELASLAYQMASEEKQQRADRLSSLLAADKNAYQQYQGQASLSQVIETDALQKVYDFAAAVSADFDDYGKIVSGSKKKKILNYIDSLDLSSEEKDDIYLAYGYPKSKIDTVPWRES